MEFKKVYRSSNSGVRRTFAEFSSSIMRKASLLEPKIECTLEELCRGCKEEVKFMRDVITKNGSSIIKQGSIRCYLREFATLKSRSPMHTASQSVSSSPPDSTASTTEGEDGRGQCGTYNPWEPHQHTTTMPRCRPPSTPSGPSPTSTSTLSRYAAGAPPASSAPHRLTVPFQFLRIHPL